MGRHPHHVCSRVGGRGRHRALRCHGVAVRARRRVRAVPDLPQRTLALRAAPRCRRSRLSAHVRRPYARSTDAAVTSTHGTEPRSTQSPHTGDNMSRKLRPLAALVMAAAIVAGCSNAPAETSTGNNTAATHEKAVKFAQCMRDNGVKDFPDPVNGEPLIDTNRIPSAATDGGMSILHAAGQKCSDYARDAGGT